MRNIPSLDGPTFHFVVKLKAKNRHWFEMLVKCARVNPKVTAQCIIEAVKYVAPYSDLTSEGVNVFQICKSVNSGELTETMLDPVLDTSALEVYRALVIKRFKEAGMLGM